MTLGQPTGPNMSWLDEELRREKGIVEELRDVIDKQQITLVDQGQRIISLEDRLTKLQNQLQQIPETQQRVQSTRDEIVLMLSELRQETQKREAEFLRNRQAEREKDLRAIQEIRMELDRIAPLEQATTVSQAEDRRINEAIMRLQQQFESLGKHISQAEEWRRQLADGINKNTVEIKQIVEEIEGYSDMRSNLTQRILPLENDLSKLQQQVAELQNMRQEVTAQQQELLERQRRSERSRTQTMTEWGRRLDGFAHQLDAWADQLRFFSDQHEKNRRILRDIQTLSQELSQQQDRLRQLQRIAEEQLRRELREARTENDQRWAQELDRREQLKAEQAVRDDRQEGRLLDLEDSHQDTAAALDDLRGRLRELQETISDESEELRQIQRQTWNIAAKSMQSLMRDVNEAFGVEE